MIRIKGSSRKEGFTLIEALAATIVLAISLLGAGLAIYIQFGFISQIREKAIATLAAQEKIEAIRGMAFDDILNPAKLSPTFTAAGPDDANKVTGLTYLRNSTGTVAVDNYIPSDPINNIRRISVTVSWRSFPGITLQQTLATLMSRNGINKQ